MPALLIVIDGVGDRPHPKYKKTPLQKARTPVLDRLVKRGICGIMDPIEPGVRPGSAPAHLALFGYDPYKYYVGRGVFEALGADMELKSGDIAFRCNFVTVDDKMVVVDRRAGRITWGEGTQDLIDALNKIKIGDVEVIFKTTPALQYRGVLVLRGKGLSWKVSDSDPGHEGSKIKQVMPEEPGARKTADILNELTGKIHDILKNHPVNRKRVNEGKPPANMFVFRGASLKTEVPTFAEKYGLKAYCISGKALYRGLAKFVGMSVVPIPEDAKTMDENLDLKVGKAIELLKTADFVFLHFKAADSFGEEGNFMMKTKFIEMVDKSLKPLLDYPDIFITVTADHSTPCSIKSHSADPVPILICGPGVRLDGTKKFDEINCAKGGLHRICAKSFMSILLDLMNKAEKYGA